MLKLYIVLAYTFFKGEKQILVPTFSANFRFSPYPEKRFPFWSLPLHQKWRKLTCQMVGINNTKLIFTWPKLIIKNVFWH